MYPTVDLVGLQTQAELPVRYNIIRDSVYMNIRVFRAINWYCNSALAKGSGLINISKN